MAQQDCTQPAGAHEPPSALERHDLEPEPVPEPTVQDILEGVAEALEEAVELAEPRRTAARCLTLLTRVQAASAGHTTADELLTGLRLLVADWRIPSPADPYIAGRPPEPGERS